MKGASVADVERRVALRPERQKYLLADNAPEFPSSGTRPPCAAPTATAR